MIYFLQLSSKRMPCIIIKPICMEIYHHTYCLGIVVKKNMEQQLKYTLLTFW